MCQRIVRVVVLVGVLTACSPAPVAPVGHGAPVPLAGAPDTTSTVPVAASPAATDLPDPGVVAPAATSTLPVPPEAMSDTTPEVIPELIAAIPPPVRVVGTIDYVYESTNDVIQAPDEVRVGEPFTVTVHTHRAGCDSAGDPIADTEVALTDNVATIRAYDYRTEGVPCAAWGARFPHTVTIQFMQPGDGVIRVEGMRVGPDDFVPGTPTTLERRVRVR